MSKDYSFNVMPSVSISRSRFARKSQHKTCFNLGEIVPIYVDEVLPGDTHSIDMASLVRMSTPMAPIMDNIYLDFFAFFVPNRLVWDHWKAFMGENETSAGIPAQSYSVPCVEDPSGAGVSTTTIGDYLGLPLGVIYYNGMPNSTGVKVSALPGRGYCLIYNEWFRNQNIIAPLAIQKGDTNEVLVGDISDAAFFYGDYSCLVASKIADYFTKALPYAQKGAAVTIPLGTTAPIIGASSLHSVGSNGVQFYSSSSVSQGTMNLYVKGALDSDSSNTFDARIGNKGGVLAPDTSKVTEVTHSNLVADLSGATAATINQLRYAFQLQKLLEKDALYGTRYWEILASHFGIKAPDASLQRPEYLGGFRQRINIDQVLSTAGYQNNSSTTCGAPGANSVTGSKGSLFTKSFTEHGYLFILAVARQDLTYCQGVNRMWTRKDRFDYYFPVFANLGAQEIKVKEIYAQGTSDDEGIFGYQEAWAEYRMRPSQCSSYMRPNASYSLGAWTLAENFASKPTLGQTFIEQGRGPIKRCLVTGQNSNACDFIADFYFEDIAVRPMPMYSIPGLIDHH